MKLQVATGLVIGNFIAFALGLISVDDAFERSLFQASAIFCVAFLERKKP